jgi:hypothetical protein
MNISINQRYKGFYEHLGTDAAGRALFSSVQSVEASALDAGINPELEVTAVNWSVDKNDQLSGKAIFHSVKTHHQVSAVLTGTSPTPPKGQNFRQAFVEVTFKGGTGNYRSAQGSAQVEAQLYDDGSSEGVIKGQVTV